MEDHTNRDRLNHKRQVPDLPELKHLSHGKLWSAFRKPCTLPYNTKQDNHARDTSRKSTLPLGQQKQTYR